MPATVSVCIAAQTDLLRRLNGPRSLINLSVPQNELRQNVAGTRYLTYPKHRRCSILSFQSCSEDRRRPIERTNADVEFPRL